MNDRDVGVQMLFRQEGEPTRYYRQRIARQLEKLISAKKQLSDTAQEALANRNDRISKDQAIQRWRTSASGLILNAYTGYYLEQSEMHNDSLGMNINHGSSAPDAGTANGAFDRAHNLTIGKPITSADFVAQVGYILDDHERRHSVQLDFKSKFLDWAREREIELRGLKEKGEQLRKAS